MKLHKDTVDALICILSNSRPTFRKVFENGGESQEKINNYIFGYDAAIKTLEKVREVDYKLTN